MSGVSMRDLRACMVCSIVQRFSDFLARGCPNCEPILGLANHRDTIQDCTSRVFEGLITMPQPTQSWVAKWQRLDGYVPGVYAVKVVGELPRDIVSALEAEGVKYIPRDGRDVDEDR